MSSTNAANCLGTSMLLDPGGGKSNKMDESALGIPQRQKGGSWPSSQGAEPSRYLIMSLENRASGLLIYQIGRYQVCHQMTLRSLLRILSGTAPLSEVVLGCSALA